MTNRFIKIKSGIDTDSDVFKNYYSYLKENQIKAPFLSMAVQCDDNILKNPPVFVAADYEEINVDDMAFIWSNEEIIGHIFTKFRKRRFVIPLGSSKIKHLSDSYKEIDGINSLNTFEYFCKEKLDIFNLLDEYAKARRNGKLESTGMIQNEKKVYIKK